jgi:hypothetical protein
MLAVVESRPRHAKDNELNVFQINPRSQPSSIIMILNTDDSNGSPVGSTADSNDLLYDSNLISGKF